MWRKQNTPTVLVRIYIGAAFLESSMEVSQETKNKTTLLIALLNVKILEICVYIFIINDIST